MKKPWIAEIVRKRNLENNPAKLPEARAKISAARKGKPTTLGKPCSPETRMKISQALKGNLTGRRPTPKSIKAFVEAGRANLRHGKGKDHPNWKGGLTPQRHKDFRSPDYIAFVQAVHERDNYTCQQCGIRNGMGQDVQLEVHHKIAYGERSGLRYAVDNGITLCRQCHNLTKTKRPKTVDFVPKERLCQICNQSFAIFNPRKYCSDCRAKYSCPICGSTTCRHAARRLYRSNLP